MTCVSVVELGASWSSILIKALATRSIPRVCLVDRERIYLRVLRTLMSVGKRVLFDMGSVGVRALLR